MTPGYPCEWETLEISFTQLVVAPAAMPSVSRAIITFNASYCLVLSLFGQVVLPERGLQGGRYEGDVSGNKAITGCLYEGDVTYGAPPARCEGSLSPAGQCFIALVLQWL